MFALNRSKLVAVLALAGMSCVASTASASLILTLDDPSTIGVIDVIVIDEAVSGSVSTGGGFISTDGEDSPGSAGLMTWSGPVGSFSVNVATGSSSPPLPGPAGERSIDLLSLNISGGAGTIIVGLTNTDFSLLPAPGPYSILSEIGGTAGGTVLTSFGADPGNAEFGTPFGGTHPLFGAGAFSGTATAGGMPASPAFSITSMVTVTHSGVGTSSFDHKVTVIPAPGAALLGMCGLSAIGWVRRRFA